MEIIIVDDQGIVRDGLKMLLSLNEEIQVIGEAANGEELLSLLKTKVPDVILMDIRMPVMNGIEATKAVKAQYPKVKVIILTTFNEDEYIFNGLKNGADGFMLKDSDLEEIIKSIKAAYEGTLMLHSQVTSKLINALQNIPEYPSPSSVETKDLSKLLTPREMEVVEQIMQGKSNKTISTTLFLTEGTVKNYVSRILDKLELKSRSELIIYLKGK
ncbi:response regulator transcription factor [Neobacillus mesonae]|uniref:response regulator n=1 Tax=Neobacillus mesonae TaxID=1193713 RepID=UPI00203BEF66|nr:response regulator transcription factor [Neobacillus mesonae]MCM3569794.1 response regulator transcription factor [Neobacillus mesonae]